jgi:PAS fold
VLLQQETDTSEDSAKTKSRVALVPAMYERIGYCDWDLLSNTMNWSRELYRICGLREETFFPTCRRFLELVHLEDREMVKRSIERALCSGLVRIHHRIVRPCGEIRTVHQQMDATFDDAGQAVRLLMTTMDLTETDRPTALDG